jgi:hypothetical protein
VAKLRDAEEEIAYLKAELKKKEDKLAIGIVTRLMIKLHFNFNNNEQQRTLYLGFKLNYN